VVKWSTLGAGKIFTAIHADRDVASLAVAGDLDRTTAAQFRAALAKASALGPGDLVIDISAAEFCDSTALDEFARGVQICMERGTRLCIFGATDVVRRRFATIGILEPLD
jgi:anti-anti-sigma factor